MRRLQKKLLENKHDFYKSLFLIGAIFGAYGLDYLYMIMASRLLAKADFGTVAALGGLGQIAVVASRMEQTIITRFVVKLTKNGDHLGRVKTFFRRMFTFTWQLAIGVTILLFLVAKPTADWLNISSVAPVLAMFAAIVIMIPRPMVDGTLQGLQRFGSLGAMQLFQAVIRIVLGYLLISAGFGAVGAIASLPIAIFATIFFGMWFFRDVLQKAPAPHQVESRELLNYSTYAALGLVGMALLMNMDVVIAKSVFTPEQVGDYSAAVTLGKIIQFLPLGIVMVLFPKAAEQEGNHAQAEKILIPAILAVMVLCFGLTAVYYFFSNTILSLTVGTEYNVDGKVLGLVGLAMTFMSLANVWLNYFLSMQERTRFVFLIWFAVIIQIILLTIFNDSIIQFPIIVAINGIWLALAGFIFFLKNRRVR